MLTAEGCADRRERLWAAAPADCEQIVIGDRGHLVYFAGFAPSPFVFRSVEAGALLVLERGRATLVADNLLGPECAAAYVDEVVAPVWYDGGKSAPDRQGRLVESALRRLSHSTALNVGVEMSGVPSGVTEGLRAARPGVAFTDVGPLTRPLRRRKDPDEVEAIRRAVRAGEAGHAAALAEVRPGMTEIDAYLIVQNAAVKSLGSRAIVYGDFVSGPRTDAEKGGPPSDRVIRAGDLLLLDFSVVVDGYRGDFTNTFAVGGTPTPRQVELFEACKEALRVAEGLLRPGTPGREIDAAVRASFAAEGLADAFTTHTGHGIGLGHPEAPFLSPESGDTLLAGDVVAVEPGLYVEGVGGMRFEHNYLITADGFETLTAHAIRLS